MKNEKQIIQESNFIKNKEKAIKLIASGKWELDPYFETINKGQINKKGDDVTYYDAETDKFETI
jgi:hypothetical protein